MDLRSSLRGLRDTDEASEGLVARVCEAALVNAFDALEAFESQRTRCVFDPFLPAERPSPAP